MAQKMSFFQSDDIMVGYEESMFPFSSLIFSFWLQNCWIRYTFFIYFYK